MAAAKPSPTEAFRPPSKDDLAPVYLLHGEEDLLRDEALQAILDAAVPADQRSFNLDVLQWGEVDARDVLSLASAYPMMADRRAVIVKDVTRTNDDEAKLLASYVEHPVETTVLVLTAAKVDTRRNPFAAIQRVGGAYKFDPLREGQLPAWIVRRLRAKRRTIDDEASELLASIAGNSLRDLDQELEKLLTYAGERTALTVEDVSAVAGVSKEYNIWALQSAIAAGESSRALAILTKMVEDGNGAPYFVVMLTMFFANVRRLHDLRRRGMDLERAAKELQRNPWGLRDAYEATTRFSIHRIEEALGLLLAVDDQSKFGGDDLTLLQTMLVQILESPVTSH